MSEEIQVVQVGAAGAALAQASAALALQYKNETSTLKGQVDTAKAAVDVAKAAVDVAKGQVDTAKTAVDVAKEAVDLSQADVIARQAVVVAAQATTEGARDTAVAQAGVATTKAAESAGSASLALAIFGTADNLNAAQQIMLGYANTAQAQAGLAASSAASASSVAQQDLSGVTAAALHRSPNAVVAMCVYDTSKDSDGGAWIERCSHLSWANEALNGTWLAATSPAGFLTELDARSRGATLGTEVSPDPTFSSSAGWTLNGSASIGSNTLTAASVGTGNAIATRSDPVGGNLALATAYQVTVVVGTLTAGAIQVRMGNTGTTLRTLSSAGTHTFTVNPGATGANMSLYASGTTTATVTRFSIKPVTANVTATGDFFQLATDGKFYSLSAGSGTTEVFRGNKAKFPRLAAIVAEAASVTIYDLTEAGRPMWGRWTIGGITSIASASSVSAGAGMVLLATGSGVFFFDLARSLGRFLQSSNDSRFELTTRALVTASLIAGLSSARIINNAVSAIAMCVMPDAPVDPVTGLQVPTIACVTVGGISIIQNDGAVRNSNSTPSFTSISINKDVMVAGITNASTFYTALKPGSLVGNFSVVTGSPTHWASTSALYQSVGAIGRSIITKRNGNNLLMLRHNEAAPTDGLTAHITGTHNTGWMAGDIRRCWLADVAAGSVTATELITDPGFDAPGSWSISGGDPSITISGSQCAFAATVNGNYVRATTAIPTSEKGYIATVVVSAYTAGGLQARVGTGTLVSFGVTGVGTYRVPLPPGATAFADLMTLGATTLTVDSFSITEAIADRTYKAKPATIYGTLTRTAVATAAQLVAYSGWSASNYIQEPYSADLDFGAGAWTCSACVSIPTTLPIANFPEVGGELAANGDFGSDTVWVKGIGWTIAAGVATHAAGTSSGITQNIATSGKVYKVGWTASGSTAGSTWPTSGGAAGTPVASGNGAYVGVMLATTAGIGINGNSTFDGSIDNVSVKELGPAIIAERAHSSGPSIRLGVDALGRLTATAYDGTTTRTVTTASYNTGQRIKARASYTTDGTLSISVNGRVVATATGTPLLTMNNASAVTTIGNSRTLDAPFPGSICLVKWGATVPTQEQMLWMYEQEKQMFRDGAQVTLPDSGSLVDVAYDDLYDRITTVSAANEANFTGLIRTSTATVPAGTYSRVARGSGVKMLSRITTSPGVDITTPSQNLREELVNRSRAAAERARLIEVFDWVGGFTASVTGAQSYLVAMSPAFTTWAGTIYPANSTVFGAQISGTGLPAGTIIGSYDATPALRLNQQGTVTNAGVAIAFTDFILPPGYTAVAVMVDGVMTQEGATKAWTRVFDGFCERVRFGTAPGATAWVQIQARRMT